LGTFSGFWRFTPEEPSVSPDLVQMCWSLESLVRWRPRVSHGCILWKASSIWQTGVRD